MDLGSVFVTRPIIHQIPKLYRSRPGTVPVLSEVEGPVNQAMLDFVRDRITTSLYVGGFDVEFDPSSSSPVPSLTVGHFLGGPQGYVKTSQAMAAHLHQSQTGANPAGLLFVLEAEVEGKPGLAILKLEKQGGIEAQQTTVNGLKTFEMRLTDELLFTTRTRIFKIGLFVQDGFEMSTIRGRVADNQRGTNNDVAVADFFLKRFLGCRLREEPRIATQRFYETAEEYFDEQVKDPILRTNYQLALHVEMNSQNGIINPTGFAADHLRPEHRQGFRDLMDAEFGLARIIDKDNELVASHLRRVVIDFQTGVTVTGSPSAFDESVTITPRADGAVHLEVDGQIRKVAGRG